MTDETKLKELTAAAVTTYFSNNSVPEASIPSVIRAIYTAFSELGTPEPVKDLTPAEPSPRAKPAVPVKDSVQPDFLVCLEDGKKLKMLKRHLLATYNLTPDQYRAKWNLPANYPMVAPNYAATRSALAKANGLGHKAPPVAAAA
jgi:predicted transcriptional regulator